MDVAREENQALKTKSKKEGELYSDDWSWNAHEPTFLFSGDESEDSEALEDCAPLIQTGEVERALSRRLRTAFNSRQTFLLEKAFRKQRYLSALERMSLAVRLQVSEIQIKNWFQNRRTKLKRKSQDQQHPMMSQPPQPPSYSYGFGPPWGILITSGYHYRGPQPNLLPYYEYCGAKYNNAPSLSMHYPSYGAQGAYYQHPPITSIPPTIAPRQTPG